MKILRSRWSLALVAGIKKRQKSNTKIAKEHTKAVVFIMFKNTGYVNNSIHMAATGKHIATFRKEKNHISKHTVCMM